MAIAYESCFPEQYDSIYYFLNKALEYKSGQKHADIELEICVYQFFAELHFDQKRYKEAEKDIQYVLSLLEQVKDDNSVVVDFSEAYKLLVKLYKALNRPAEALKYSELLLENEKRRYENDKIVAMDDMLVKYEVEKKNEQIDRMAERERATRNILILTSILIVTLLVGLIILILLQRLRKRNYEQSIYEAALLTELKQNELESIKQRLEQNPIEAVIGKLTEWITLSAIEKIKKSIYIQQLSELDMDMLEKGYFAAHEKLTNLDMKYIICFAMDMDVKDMSLLFNIEATSIYIIRYRIKRKFGDKNSFTFLM
jgi:tetratricopeptide (TPR) repeat protein